MPNKTLIKHLLHVKNTVINSMKLITAVDDEEQVVINARPTKGHRCLCPICMKRAPYYDSLEPRRWRSLDFGYTKVFIEAPVIRVDCPEHGVLTAWVPWARHHSMFTRDFENTVVWMSLYLPKTAVSEYMRIAWNTIGPIISRYKADADPFPEHRFNNLRHIGIDETSYRKGHKYITVIVDHDTNSVIWVHDKHGKEVLKQFFELLSEEQRTSIECVTADGARWISETMDEYIPQADRCLDFYHLVEWAQDALDDVRTEAWRRVRKKTKNKNRIIYSPFHAFTDIVLSNLSCSAFGTLEKKFSPVAFSTASTVTAKVANGSWLPSLGRMNPIIFCGGVRSKMTL